MEFETVRKAREFWCRVFGMPLSELDDIDNCVVLGERNLDPAKYNTKVEAKPKKKKEKKKKKKRR